MQPTWLTLWDETMLSTQSATANAPRDPSSGTMQCANFGKLLGTATPAEPIRSPEATALHFRAAPLGAEPSGLTDRVRSCAASMLLLSCNWRGEQ